MATRFKATDLKEMIRLLVREEMRGVIKETIDEVLSERYLRQLAETAMPRKDVKVQEEETPQVLANVSAMPQNRDEEYRVAPDNLRNIGMSENDTRNEMLSLFFEGTKPLNESEMQAPEIEEGVKIEALVKKSPGKKSMTEVWRQLAGVNKQTQSAPANAEALEAREEKRLKMLRESLERQVNG